MSNKRKREEEDVSHSVQLKNFVTESIYLILLPIMPENDLRYFPKSHLNQYLQRLVNENDTQKMHVVQQKTLQLLFNGAKIANSSTYLSTVRLNGDGSIHYKDDYGITELGQGGICNQCNNICKVSKACGNCPNNLCESCGFSCYFCDDFLCSTCYHFYDCKIQKFDEELPCCQHCKH